MRGLVWCVVGVVCVGCVDVPPEPAGRADKRPRNTPATGPSASGESSPAGSSEEGPASAGDSGEEVDSSRSQELPDTTPAREVVLVLEEWHFGSEHGFMIARGRVTNNTNRPLEAVKVVVQYFTSTGQFVRSDWGLVEYNPILPGQTSPFEVIGTDHPSIAKGSISFTTILGTPLSFSRREDFDKPTPAELAEMRRQREEAIRRREEVVKRVEELKRQIAEAEEKAKWRVWKTADGLHERRAKFAGVFAGKVKLEREDGKVVEVPRELLCEADQEFIKRKAWKDAAKDLREQLEGIKIPPVPDPIEE